MSIGFPTGQHGNTRINKLRTLPRGPMVRTAYNRGLEGRIPAFLECINFACSAGMALLNDEEFNDLTGSIIGGGMAVHRTFGPGLLESVYDVCFAYELSLRGLNVQRGVDVPIRYKGLVLDKRLKLDLLVNDTVVVEVKAIDALLPVHRAQVLTYLKLASRPVGLLINFNVPMLKDGIRRVVNPALLGGKVLPEEIDEAQINECGQPGPDGH